MDLVSACSLRVGSILWQPRPGAWMLTVVCKATYVLLPVESPLAHEQDPLKESDEHWNDDERRSLQAASDLVPFKRRADVFLVGHAYAPRRQPVSSLVVRLIVGDVDKAIEVHADRVWTQDGQLREGSQFTKMPLQRREEDGTGTILAILANVVPMREVLPFVKPERAEIEPEQEQVDLSIERFSAISAEIAEGRAARTEVLRRHELNERAWTANEQRWTKVLEEESANGSSRIRTASDRAYVEAVEGFRGPITLSEYARIAIGLERGRANQVLDNLKIQRPALMRIVRVWTKKIATDAKLTEEARVLLSASRSS